MYTTVAVWCNVCAGMAGIAVQGHMSIMWNICIPGFLITLLIALSSYEEYIYILTGVSCAHDIIGLCGLYMAFEGYIGFWHTPGSTVSCHMMIKMMQSMTHYIDHVQMIVLEVFKLFTDDFGASTSTIACISVLGSQHWMIALLHSGGPGNC